MDIHMIDFQEHGDDRGALVVAETMKDIPFEVKRLYYIYGVGEGIRRGYHSHKELLQVYIAIHGSMKVLLDDGTQRQTVELNKPYQGLYIGHNVWREIYDFSHDAVLLVASSEHYSENDYIRNYDEFIDSLKGENNK